MPSDAFAAVINPQHNGGNNSIPRQNESWGEKGSVLHEMTLQVPYSDIILGISWQTANMFPSSTLAQGPKSNSTFSTSCTLYAVQKGSEPW